MALAIHGYNRSVKDFQPSPLILFHQVITSGNLNNDDRQLSLATGEYTLVFQGTGADPNYKFRIVAPDLPVTAYTLGTTITGTIGKPGEQDTYTFRGSAGQLLSLDTLTGNPNLTVQVYSPSGVQWVNRGTTSDGAPFILSESGTYRLVVDGVNDTMGNYSLRLLDRSAAPLLDYNTPLGDSLTLGNSQKLYQLNGQAGQVVNFALSAPNWTGANWVLYDPAGVAIVTPNSASPNFKAVLAATGIYTLVISGTNTTPVSYGFQVQDVTPASIAKTGWNTVQSGSFTAAGQVKDYTFTATAGTVLLYDGMDADPWVRVQLLNPDGTAVFGNNDARVDRGPIVLGQTGTYKVQHFTSGQASGTYQFKVQELPKNFGPTTNYLELGSPVSGTLSQGQTKVYTFQANPGMKILFNGMSGEGVNANLYDVNGNLVFNLNNFRSLDTGVYTLPLGTVYNLVISADPGATRSYSFQVLEDLSSPEITYNLPSSNNLDSSQKSALYKLEATQGDTLFFDNLSFNAPGYPGNPGALHWIIYEPDGTQITNQELRNNFEVKATQTGTYLLYVQGTEAATPYNYQFRVFAQSPDTRLNVVTPGVGQSASNTDGSLGQFKVTVQAKDDKGASALQDYTIRLWADPINSNPVILSQPDPIYAYDASGNRTSVTTASGTTSYTFDERNWLDAVVTANGVTDYDYNPIGNLVHTQFANGTQENRQYDALNRLLYLENKQANGQVISSYTYTLDKAGNRQSVLENTGRKVDYAYDALYRLTQEQIADGVQGNRTTGYGYDKVGNRLTKTDSQGTTAYAYDGNDRLLNEKVAGQITTSYTYDNNGNTLTKMKSGEQTTYTWDDQNRLVAANVVTGTSTKNLGYQYDPNGIRVASNMDGQETRYLIDSVQPYAQVLEEYTPNGTVQTFYVYGNDLISQTQAGNMTYYHVDGLGSTRALTDAMGNVVNTSSYDAFGEKIGGTGSTSNKYLFAGEQFDEGLGDYYLRARYYDTETGRFARRDTYEGRLLDPLTLHKYFYTNNNPINAIDPSGLETMTSLVARDVVLSNLLLYAAPIIVTSVAVYYWATIKLDNSGVNFRWVLHSSSQPPESGNEVSGQSLAKSIPIGGQCPIPPGMDSRLIDDTINLLDGLKAHRRAVVGTLQIISGLPDGQRKLLQIHKALSSMVDCGTPTMESTNRVLELQRLVGQFLQ